MTKPPGKTKMNFDTAFTRLIDSEGGYINNPADPGGAAFVTGCKFSIIEI